MRAKWLVGLALILAPLVLVAQDTTITGPGIDTVITVPDTVAVDTASTPPVSIPTPTEPGWKGWVQAYINEYAFPLLISLSSAIMLWVTTRWPTFARYGNAIKLLSLFAQCSMLYLVMRWLGGTLTGEAAAVVGQGLGPVIAAFLTAAGVFAIGQKQKVVVAEARQFAALKTGRGR